MIILHFKIRQRNVCLALETLISDLIINNFRFAICMLSICINRIYSRTLLNTYLNEDEKSPYVFV